MNNIKTEHCLKGISWNEKYGKEYADKLRENLRKMYKGRTSIIKGKTFEELYGKEKAGKLKNNLRKVASKKFKGKLLSLEHRKKISEFQSQSYEEKWGKETAERVKAGKIGRAPHNKGKNAEELYGKEKAENMRLKNSLRNKGKTYEEIYGIEKAKELREKKSKSYEEKFGKERALKIKMKKSESAKIWNREQVIKLLQKIVKDNGYLTKTEIWNLYKYDKTFPSSTYIRQEFGNVNGLIKAAFLKFKQVFNDCGRIGKKEKHCLDVLEQNFGYKIHRQHFIAGKFVDGYISELNLIIEYDEMHHEYLQIEDKIRENKIREVKKCKFLRIKEWEYNKVQGGVLV